MCLDTDAAERCGDHPLSTERRQRTPTVSARTPPTTRARPRTPRFGSMSPSTSAATRSLDAGNGQGFVVSFPVPAGRYRVYVWSMEDFRDHFRDLDLVVEGSPVATAIHDLPLWSWARFGPYAADVADGRLDVEVLRHSKGDPVINGLAVFTEVDAAPVH